MEASLLIFLSIIIITVLVEPLRCFSIGNGNDITSVIQSNTRDATTLSPMVLDTIESRAKSENPDECDMVQCKINILSDFHRQSETDLTLQEYNTYTASRNLDCVDLFDRYESKVLRCETITNTRTLHSYEEEINIRWQASWIGAGSVWLFELADNVGWKVEKKVPDSSRISTFSWRDVGQVFQKAFQTGIIQLPVYVVEGNSRLRIRNNQDESNVVAISITESIDLVREADLARLQNRKVAQELASWLDVSRSPIHIDGKESDWAATVRERILTGVPGTGPLDVDPNEDNSGPILIFGVTSLAAFGFLYMFLLENVIGGTGQISKF